MGYRRVRFRSCGTVGYGSTMWVKSRKGDILHDHVSKMKCFFLWVDALAKTLMNELQEEHEEWLRMLPRTTVAAARAPEEEMEGEARTDRELAVELGMLKKKVW
uniref:Uncharacterized protein n=1 Tax=Aegilops tauschii TaxID=37682 RepID=M8CHC9_AEGTA